MGKEQVEICVEPGGRLAMYSLAVPGPSYTVLTIYKLTRPPTEGGARVNPTD
jgi:hypothetical protein